MKLIINGDDFGLNESCSLAIAEAMQRGLIDRTTMTANGEYFEKAAIIANFLCFTDRVGVHFNLTEGRPLTEEIAEIPDFVTEGRFNKKYLRDPRPLSEKEQAAVFGELSAQAERIKSMDIPLTHADSHHYIHTFVHIAPIVARVCAEQEITSIRINRTFDSPKRPRITEGRASNSLWRERGFETTAHFGRLSDIRGIEPPDDLEIMVHPDYNKRRELIDRTGVEDGFPVGEPLSDIDFL